jgi:tetratricopeptide (TPR) repeat protein
LNGTLSYFLGLLLFTTSAWALSPVRELLQENRLDDAVPICRQFDVLSTNDTDSMFACAWVYYRTDRTDSAEKILDKLKNKFSLPEYQLLLAYGRIVKKQYDEARKIISVISSDNKGTSIALSADELSAEIYEILGQLDTAAFIYKHVVDDDSKRARAHWGLGRYYLSRGDNRRAIYHLEQTTKLWPKHMGSRFNLGVLYLSQDNTAEAARWLSDCYRLNKADAGVLEQLGVLFEKKGDIKEAIKQWQRAVEIKKDSPLAKEKLAAHSVTTVDSLMDSKKYPEALAKLESTKGINEQPRLLLRRATIYRNTGKWDKASVDFRNYLTAKPNDADASRELAICYLNLKLMDQALEYFSKAATLQPDEGLNHAWLGFMLEHKKQFPEAREEWKKAVALIKDPKELQKATRRLAAIDKRKAKLEKKRARNENAEWGE